MGGYESRQVMDFAVSVHVTEYRAQILIDEKGNQFVADFSEFVTRPIQYGPKTKASSVYMSQYQLISYNQIEDHLTDQIGLNISTGFFLILIRRPTVY